MGRNQEKAVYAAEEHLQALLRFGAPVDFHGSMLDLPVELRFGDLRAARDYLMRVRAQPWGHGSTPQPQIVAFRGTRRATWTPPDRIAVPPGQNWAMRETVVLHEYAHHVNYHVNRSVGHDRDFCHVLLDLIDHAISPAAALIMRAALTEGGVLPSPGSS